MSSHKIQDEPGAKSGNWVAGLSTSFPIFCEPVRGNNTRSLFAHTLHDADYKTGQMKGRFCVEQENVLKFWCRKVELQKLIWLLSTKLWIDGWVRFGGLEVCDSVNFVDRKNFLGWPALHKYYKRQDTHLTVTTELESIYVTWLTIRANDSYFRKISH